MSQTKTEPQAKVGEKEQLRRELLRLIVKNAAAAARMKQSPYTVKLSVGHLVVGRCSSGQHRPTQGWKTIQFGSAAAPRRQRKSGGGADRRARQRQRVLRLRLAGGQERTARPGDHQLARDQRADRPDDGRVSRRIPVAGTVIKADHDWDLAAIAIWRPTAEPLPLAATARSRAKS